MPIACACISCAAFVSERSTATSVPAHAVDMLAGDADAIASLIYDAVRPEKCTAIVAALNVKLTHWRCGSHPLLNQPGQVSSYCADPTAAAGLSGPRRLRQPRPD